MKLIFSLLFALTLLTTGTTTSIAAGTSCDSMTKFGKPIVYTPPTSPPTYLCRRLYVLEHSATRKTAFWVAEHIYGKDLGVSETRVNAFKADPDLPKNEAATPADYKKSGYDQGHMAPVGNMHKDKAAMLESFYLSNMVPQHPKNNRDGWNHLESYIREMAQVRTELYVITGPIYSCKDLPCKTIGPNKVQVPTHLYKIVYDPHKHVALSFIVPNQPFTLLEANKFISTVDAIEELTLIKFFPTSIAPIFNSKKMWTAKTSD
jgi:endonuclease G